MEIEIGLKKLKKKNLNVFACFLIIKVTRKPPFFRSLLIIVENGTRRRAPPSILMKRRTYLNIFRACASIMYGTQR